MSRERLDERAYIDALSEYINPEWFGHDLNALKIVAAFVRISHVWDDLIDRDEQPSKEMINDVFYDILVGLPSIPLWGAIQQEAVPILAASIAAYHVANTFEEDGDEAGLEIAHGLRYSLGHLFVLISIATLGWHESQKHQPAIWRFVFAERLAPYLEEHRK